MTCSVGMHCLRSPKCRDTACPGHPGFGEGENWAIPSRTDLSVVGVKSAQPALRSPTFEPDYGVRGPYTKNRKRDAWAEPDFLDDLVAVGKPLMKFFGALALVGAALALYLMH